MVFHNSLFNGPSDPNYGNETFRARHGYKEVAMHDAPYRRNRDFKPVNYGSWKGMLNYRHSEPYMHLKNMKDISRDDHHIVIKASKNALKGGLLGSIFGYLYFIGGNTGPFEMSKLLSSTGNRPFSGQAFRMFRQVLGRYALGGAALAVSYQVIIEWGLRHHDEANRRPAYLDHTLATTLIGGVTGMLIFKHPLHIFSSFFFSAVLVAPTLWWFANASRMNPTRAPNIFYENTCTKEEIERYRHQDMIENLGQTMIA